MARAAPASSTRLGSPSSPDPGSPPVAQSQSQSSLPGADVAAAADGGNIIVPSEPQVAAAPTGIELGVPSRTGQTEPVDASFEALQQAMAGATEEPLIATIGAYSTFAQRCVTRSGSSARAACAPPSPTD